MASRSQSSRLANDSDGAPTPRGAARARAVTRTAKAAARTDAPSKKVAGERAKKRAPREEMRQPEQSESGVRTVLERGDCGGLHLWTLQRLDAELARIGDNNPEQLNALVDKLNAEGVELALGAEEPPEDPKYRKLAAKSSAWDRGGDSSDPLALLFHEAQRRPRPTRDEERRLFRRVVFARHRLDRTLQQFNYPKGAVDDFLKNAPCVALRPSERSANGEHCLSDDQAPCIRFASLCGMQVVHSRCCTYHEARNSFVVRYLYLVLGMVRRYRDRGIDTADLVQEGSAALMRAVEDFEPERGFRFSTYARWWVNQAFLRTMYNHLRTVRLPVYLQKAAAKIMRHAGDRDFREIDVQKLSQMSGVPESTIRILAEFSRSTVSLDSVTGDREKAVSIADPRADFKPERIDRRNVRGEVEKALLALSERERKILSLRFGLDATFPRTLEEVGEVLNLSRERVRQIQEEALAKLRSPLHLNRLRDLLDFG